MRPNPPHRSPLNFKSAASSLTVSILATGLLMTPVRASPVAATAASDTVDVQHVMDAFHAAVVAHDGARLSALFAPEGSTWFNVMSDDAYARAKTRNPNVQKLRVSRYQDFAKFVTTTKDALDPRHSDVRVRSDGAVATVSFDFAFYINGKVENRGLETWQLVKGAEGWRIAAISYSSNPASK